MDNIDIYTNSSLILLRKTPSKILSWITVLILASIFIMIFMCSFKYKTYLKYDSYIKNGYIEFFVDKRFFEKIKNDTFLIKGENYDYDIVSISEFSYEYGKTSLWKIIIQSNLPDDMLLENNYFQIRFLVSDETIIKRIIDKLRSWLNL